METGKKYQGCIYCADAIIWRHGAAMAPHTTEYGFIIREHGSEAGKFALVGGKQEPNETLQQTLSREVQEEVGIAIGSIVTEGCYAERGRDSRGDFISVTFSCMKVSDIKNAKPETHLLWMNRQLTERIIANNMFAWDHGKAMTDYFARLDFKAQQPYSF